MNILFISEILTECGDWHALESFKESLPPPIGCGLPYDSESEIRPSWQGKKLS